VRILQAYRRMEQGGTERMVQTLAEEWTAAGHDVFTWLPGAIAIPDGFPFIGGEAYPGHVRPDVVVVHGGILGAANLGLSQAATGVPVVEVIHRCHPAEPGASRYVAVSVAAARVQSRVRCAVIPNGVRVGPVHATRAQARSALGLDGDALVVARHGRTEIEKGWHWTMATMERVWASGARATLLVVGATGGPATAVLRAWARERPCVIVDWQDRPAELLVAADVYLETSPEEAFGLAAAEAGLLGLPVVAFRAPGVAETLGRACAAVGLGDTAGAASALIALGGDARARGELGDRLRRRVATRFDPGLCARRYVRLFRSLRA
jgi:glycosyltransferase involved in cell wall biosynthesis